MRCNLSDNLKKYFEEIVKVIQMWISKARDISCSKILKNIAFINRHARTNIELLGFTTITTDESQAVLQL